MGLMQLAGTYEGGWERLMGRQPTPDDLLIPSSERKHLLDPQVLLRFHQDLEALGFRARRTHDARRTFVSLSLADGARRDILRWITHGPEGDIVSLYTTLPWDALCAEVSKLRVEVREGRLLKFQKLAAVGCDSPCDSPNDEAKKLSSRVGLEAKVTVPRAGLEPARLAAPPPQDGVSTSSTTWAFLAVLIPLARSALASHLEQR